MRKHTYTLIGIFTYFHLFILEFYDEMKLYYRRLKTAQRSINLPQLSTTLTG